MELNLIDKILERENLFWAWEKVKFFYKPGDVWCDEIELSGFEANLNNEFDQITEDIKGGKYKLAKIRPIGFPKFGSDENGKLKTRQTFYVSVRDQVTWIAVLNIIGAMLDPKMPFWSYGNRLFISVFPDSTNPEIFKFGHYRNTSKHLLRKWTQSWPMFRKHIAVTIKKMTHTPLDEDEKMIVSGNPDSKFVQLHCKYLDTEYWSKPLSGQLYWASIDFKKFYPSAKISTIKKTILKYLPGSQITQLFATLIESLFNFEIDINSWEKEELNDIDISTDEGKPNIYENLPTGLFASHFLANVLMLDVDLEVHDLLVAKRNIAHFRYVDDHVMLSDNFEDLITWINDYKKILTNHSTGAEISIEKTKPDKLKNIMEDNFLLKGETSSEFKTFKEAELECKLDPDYPSPLMTQTLAKISKINKTEFDLLDSDDKERFIGDIEHLMLAEFDDQEMKKDTRLSYTATLLSKLVPKLVMDNAKIENMEAMISGLSYLLKENKFKSQEDKDKCINEIENLKPKILKEGESLKHKYSLLYKRTLKLLTRIIYENYDKPRLWTRALEFCYKTGSDVKDILDLKTKLKTESKASDLTIVFIESLVLQVISDLSLKAARDLLSKTCTHRQRETSNAFIKSIRTKSIEDIATSNTKFYHRKSVHLFRATLKSINFVLFGEERIDYKMETELAKVAALNSNTTYDSYEASWIWFYNSRLCPDFLTPSIIWKNGVLNLQFNNSLDVSLALLYPSHLSIDTLKKIKGSISNEGWLFQFIKSQKEDLSELGRIKEITPVIKKTIPKPKSKTLFEWNTWLLEFERDKYEMCSKGHKDFFDARLSEWTCLEIVRQISSLLIGKLERIPIESSEYPIYKFVHPNNYLIPELWYSNNNRAYSWEEWVTIVKKGIKFNRTNIIHDERYSPKLFEFGDIENRIESAILGLGSLLTCLLAKNFELPANWNPIGHQRAWINLIYNKISGLPISSLTLQILHSIFSKRNKETKLLNLFFPDGRKDYEYEDDTLLDPPPILTLTDLNSFVTISQKNLRKYQINIQNNLPRQLIPVSFKQLTKQYMPYEEADE